MKTGLRKGVLIALAGALVLAGCDYLPFGYTALKEIVAAPAQFEGREVKVKGRVRDVIKLPILGQAYTLEEGGAEVMVSTQGALPAVKAEVALKGTVKSTAIIGGQSLGLRIEETQRLR